VALAIGGVDSDGTPKLFETDPSGTPYEWKATAIGGNREALQSFLEDEYRTDMDLDSGVALALETIAQGEDDEAVDPQAAEVTVIDTETHRVRSLDPEEIASHLDELDAGGDADE
jgi:proteasome alpha subunit